MPGPFYPGYVTKGDFSAITSVQEHELGTLGYASNGRILEYVKFTQNLKRYNWVGRDTSDATADRAKTAAMLITSSTHAPVGVAEYGGTANSYGWITRYGPATAKVGSPASQGQALVNDAGASGTLSVGLFTSATAQISAIGAGIGGVLAAGVSATGTCVDVNCL